MFEERNIVTYLKETKKERRLWDIYTGMANNKRPPYLQDMFLEATKEHFLMQHEHEEIPKQWDDDCFVLETVHPHDQETIFLDITNFLNKQRISFINQTTLYNRHVEHAEIFFSPALEIW